MNKWLSEIPGRIKESFTWLSVQVMSAWGLVWVIYSQLPADTLQTLNTTKFWVFTVPAWMGIVQTAMTYFARMKRTPDAP